MKTSYITAHAPMRLYKTAPLHPFGNSWIRPLKFGVFQFVDDCMDLLYRSVAKGGFICLEFKLKVQSENYFTRKYPVLLL